MNRKRFYSLDEGDLSTFLVLWQILLLTSSCFSSFCFVLKQKSNASDTYRSGSETHVATFFLMVLKIYLDKCRILIVYPSFVTFKSNVWAMYDALHQDVASQASMYNTWFHGHWIMPCTHIYIHVTTSSIHLSLTDSNRVWANATPLEMYFFFLADLCQAALGWALVWVWPIKRK